MAQPFRKRIVVVGAGAAGMMAALGAAKCGAEVVVLEKNPRPGRKIGISGKGRCNLTNAEEMSEWPARIVSNPRFMYSALAGFSNRDMMELIESAGVPLKVERGGRVFPVSDSARDIIDALVGLVKEAGVTMRTGITVRSIERSSGAKGSPAFLVKSDHESCEADAVILATGGMSYSKTGSTGDGYRLAAELGHTIVEPRPALIPFTVKEEWVAALQGLSLRNVELCFREESGKTLWEGFGEMLFTHFGVSGPLVLSASSFLQRWARTKHTTLEEANVRGTIDLKPALTEEKLDLRLQREVEEHRYRQMDHIMTELVPERLAPCVLLQAGISPERKASELSRKERRELVNALKKLTFTVSGTRPIEEAIVTAGGVNVKEIEPGTMQSRKCPGLYFAGELMDVDAVTGGYNLQISFSTGWAAGRSAARTDDQ